MSSLSFIESKSCENYSSGGKLTVLTGSVEISVAAPGSRPFLRPRIPDPIA
jgi:hypothetical protein